MIYISDKEHEEHMKDANENSSAYNLNMPFSMGISHLEEQDKFLLYIEFWSLLMRPVIRLKDFDGKPYYSITLNMDEESIRCLRDSLDSLEKYLKLQKEHSAKGKK